MRVNLPNLIYAVSHPIRCGRYLFRGDHIPYQTIAKLLPANPVILEAGAHNGSDTLEIAEFWPEAQIYAFEPVPAAFNALCERTRPYGRRVTCFQLGLGPAKNKMTMHLSGDGSAGNCQSSSLLAPVSAHEKEFAFVEFGNNVDVDVTTIDTWALENSIQAVDFLRLDLQGFEIEALRGAAHILTTAKAVQLEVSNVRLYENAPLYPTVTTWMRAAGFVPVVEAFFRVGGNVLFRKLS